MRNFIGSALILSLAALLSCESKETPAVQPEKNSDYNDLVSFFHKWRKFEKPPVKDGAPDYTVETFQKRWPQFQKLSNELNAFDTAGWKISEKVDWMIIWAEMNGYDFNHNILKPWQRDPAFYKSLWTYKSDVPAHEGPTHHMTTEIWTYTFPLSAEEKVRLLSDLSVIPPLNEQAKMNLTGNAKDLWVAGIRDIENQVVNLKAILYQPGIKEDAEVVSAIQDAINSTYDLVVWLKDEAGSKTGPSGIGKENYTWYLQNVHLVPLTWEDEVMLLKNELAKAWSSLKLEEHRNRSLPNLEPADGPEAYQRLAEASSESLINFLHDQDIVTVKDYFKPALDEHLGQYIPAETRNFFWITAHYDPRPLYSHFYHWFELARMEKEPNASAIRRVPLLYNIFDSRNEGMATAVEEFFMHAGLY
ncbi:MAG: hypothetical protein AAGA02_12030, partial [Bacteroidota bacterium]